MACVIDAIKRWKDRGFLFGAVDSLRMDGVFCQAKTGSFKKARRLEHLSTTSQGTVGRVFQMVKTSYANYSFSTPYGSSQSAGRSSAQ